MPTVSYFGGPIVFILLVIYVSKLTYGNDNMNSNLMEYRGELPYVSLDESLTRGILKTTKTLKSEK